MIIATWCSRLSIFQTLNYIGSNSESLNYHHPVANIWELENRICDSFTFSLESFYLIFAVILPFFRVKTHDHVPCKSSLNVAISNEGSKQFSKVSQCVKTTINFKISVASLNWSNWLNLDWIIILNRTYLILEV